MRVPRRGGQAFCKDEREEREGPSPKSFPTVSLTEKLSGAHIHSPFAIPEPGGGASCGRSFFFFSPPWWQSGGPCWKQVPGVTLPRRSTRPRTSAGAAGSSGSLYRGTGHPRLYRDTGHASLYRGTGHASLLPRPTAL